MMSTSASQSQELRTILHSAHENTLRENNIATPCESLYEYIILCHRLKLKCVLVYELLAWNMAAGLVDLIRIANNP